VASLRIYKRLQDQRDVDPNGLPHLGLPRFHTDVSKFVVETVGGGGGGGSFSLGASSLGNTLGDTGITGSRVVLAGIGAVTLSQATDADGGTISISADSAPSFSAGISGGNTDGQTGITGTRVALAGGANITLSGATDANGGTVSIIGPATVAQSVQTQDRFDLTAAGNTAGALALVSSGTLTLAGGNSITVSQNGNAITISGATTSQSVQTQPIQTGISSIVASNATYTSGSVQFTGSGIVTIRSSANQRVVVDASQSVQTQSRFNLTLAGNTSGALADVSSGTLTLAGGDNITLSQAGNAITISGPNAAGAQTGISGIANSQTTFTSGTVSLSELGAITIRSTTGNQLQLSVAPQSVQPETQTFLGGIAASDTTYTSGTVRFTGVGGGITVSSNTGQRVDLSVAAQSVQPGVQNLVASNTTFSSGTVSISGFGDVTVNTAANIIRISAPVQTAESQSIGMSNLGNTSGTTGIASGAQVRMLFAGGNNVTLSQSLNGASGTISISAGNQTVQTQNVVDVSLSGNTAGAMALISSGTMTLAGGNNITVSQNGNAVTISGPSVGGAQTGISGIIASDATYTSGTVQFTGSNMITVKSSAGQRVVIDATQSVQPGVQNIVASDATFSSGTVSISGFGDVTVNTAANLIRVSAPAQTVESQSFGMSNLGNTSGTTGIASGGQVRFLLAGGNNITLSQSINGASGTITISAPNAVAQTNQTLGMYAVQNTTAQSSSTTMDARTLSIAGDGAVSVGYSAGSLRISAPTQTGTQFSAGVSGGNTAGDTGTVAGRLVLAGGANITLSGSTNGASETVSIVGGGGGFSAGASNLGNTAGATGVTGTRIVLVGTNNITLSQTTGAAGATISISGAGGGAGQFSAGVSTGGNTAGATGLTGTQLVLVGTNAISLSQTTGANGGTVSIDAPATSSLVGTNGVQISTNGSTISVQLPFRTQFYPFNDIPIVTGQQGQGTLHVAPLHFPNIQHDRLLLGMQISNATNSSNSITISAWAGIYSRNASSISLISSISTSTNFTGSGTVGSYSLYGGPKWLSIPWTNTITEDDYWFGIVIRTTTGGGAGHTVSQLCVSKFTNSAWSGLLGAGANATDQYQLGLGVYSASTSGIPASIAFTQIQGSGSMALREPVFHLRSGTV
jgi:hypothetical protein